MSRTSVIVLGGWTAMLVFACSPRPEPPSGAPREPKQPGHWVHDERLRTLMAELSRAAAADWPQELGDDAAARILDGGASFSEAVTHAGALADGARRITETAPLARLAEVDRRSFQAQAETLYDQAVRLKKAAEIRSQREMQSILADIDATCRSCHTRFRDVAGALDRSPGR